MRVQGLVTLWGLGLFNEVVICLHRGSPLNPKFTVSSGSVYKLLSVSNKNASRSPHAWEWYVRYNDVFQLRQLLALLCDATTSGFVYVQSVADIETYACGFTAPRAKCKLYLSGQLAGTSTLAKEGCVLPHSGVFVQPFFKGAEDFPAVALQFAPGPSEKQHQHLSNREGTENTIHSAVCLKC